MRIRVVIVILLVFVLGFAAGRELSRKAAARPQDAGPAAARADRQAPADGQPPSGPDGSASPSAPFDPAAAPAPGLERVSSTVRAPSPGSPTPSPPALAAPADSHASSPTTRAASAGAPTSSPAALVASGASAAPAAAAPASPAPVSGLSAPGTYTSPIPGDFMDEEKRDIQIFRRAAPSVVHITSLEVQRDFFFDIQQVREGTGSGIVWDRAGHIVTNFHVIQGADRFEVRISDQSSYEARVVGAAPEKDLAVLKIKAPAEKLVPLELGRSQELLVGQRTLAVGNPFGLDQTLTIGVVSALGRELQSPNGRTIHDVIQTDAAINPGNSGGPLLDSRGRLIGLNSAIYSPSGASAGIGFAIPVDTVKRLAAQLITHGRSIQPGIGVLALPDAYTERLGLKGVVIQEVSRGGPADEAGLKGLSIDRWGAIRGVGDRIVAINGTKVHTLDDLLSAFEEAGVGAHVTLTVARDGHTRDVRLTLEAR